MILFFLVLRWKRGCKFGLSRDLRARGVLGFFLCRLGLLRDALQMNGGGCGNGLHLGRRVLRRRKLFFVNFS